MKLPLLKELFLSFFPVKVFKNIFVVSPDPM